MMRQSFFHQWQPGLAFAANNPSEEAAVRAAVAHQYRGPRRDEATLMKIISDDLMYSHPPSWETKPSARRARRKPNFVLMDGCPCRFTATAHGARKMTAHNGATQTPAHS
jgi:hypothetical protein